MIHQYRGRTHWGFSLIELMIALLIGSLLVLGMVSLFSTTSNVNRMESGLARLQENGRFAMEQIARDIRMATSGRGMRKDALAPRGQAYGDRGIVSHVDFGLPQHREHGLPGNAGEIHAYVITPAFLLRGYECDGAGCAPGDELPGVAGNGADHYNGGIPALGTGDGSRAAGADVLTLRYLRGVGVPLDVASDPDFALVGAEGETIPLAEALEIGPSGLIVIGDHQTTAIVSVAESNGSFTSLTLQGNISGSIATIEGLEGDIRVSDFDSDFLTVTYFLRLVDDPGRPGRRISTLVRRVSGQVQEIAQGIERMDFLYHIEDRNGAVSILSADQMRASGVIDTCPDLSFGTIPQSSVDTDAPFCSWRMVRAIEVFLLANTIDNVGVNEEPFLYSFLSNGSENVDNIVEVACYAPPCEASNPVTTLISGLPAERMLRREFRSISTLRNNAI